MHLFIRRRPFVLARLARIYASMTFRGFTFGHYGIGIVHFQRAPKPKASGSKFWNDRNF